MVYGTSAIGILLSGTARDGMLGLRVIKEHGGLTFAEVQRSEGWRGILKNTIEAGVVDFVLPIGQIPLKLINVCGLYGTHAKGGDGQKSILDRNGIKSILSIVQQHSGTDFSHYRQPTVQGRIDRRMAICQMKSYPDYLGFLRGYRTEREFLFQDLLVKVTSFFRDPEVFGELGKSVFPKLLVKPDPDEPIRMWAPACSTGEEAYSLAIGLFDIFGGLTAGYNLHRTKIQIFATDISKSAINKARMGIYSPSEVKPLSEWQLEDYFIKTDVSYQVVKPIRDTIVFSAHNLLRYPPFRKLDLISCRNILSHLNPLLHKKVLSTLHYALEESGFLLMGKSETIGIPSELFVPFSKEGNIHSRKPGSGRFLQLSPGPGKEHKVPVKTPAISARVPQTDFRKSAEAILVSKYTPVGVITDGRMEVVHFKGSVALFLEPSIGKPSHELMKMVRKELAFELRDAIHKAKVSQETVIKEAILMKHDGQKFSVTIEIVPLTDVLDPHYLILFEKKSGNTPFLEKVWKKLKPALTSLEKNNYEQRITALESELEQAREDMRLVDEQQEAYNEELQCANEELLSSNEELLSRNEEMQRLNEELTISREELQSINEEIIAINREMLEKQEEYINTLDCLHGFIANFRKPFVVLETHFRKQSAKASYYKRFNVNRKKIEGKLFFEVHDNGP